MKLYFLAPLFFQKLIWVPTRLILRIFGHIKIYGLENIEGLQGPVIFAANHSSEIDPLIVPSSLPFWSCYSPLFYATREKSFYSKNGWRKHLFGGLFINAWGGYCVNVGLRDYEKSLKDHIQIGRDGGSFCVYPEGGITPDGTIQPARGGVAYLAERAKCTIVPVGVSGVYNTPFKDFFAGKRHINVYFGKPITQKELREKVSSRSTQGMHMY
ncbi:MAG: 1-acyl-sn-glycerol-3-phosphate acyltransferase, 1-acyl-sn-glycerol-3-phosphate acyltransferase, partial [Candidatus Parcubacteria bacterium]